MWRHPLQNPMRESERLPNLPHTATARCRWRIMCTESAQLAQYAGVMRGSGRLWPVQVWPIHFLAKNSGQWFGHFGPMPFLAKPSLANPFLAVVCCLFWRRFAPARCASFTSLWRPKRRRDCALSLYRTVLSVHST